jgi:transcriptional regulator with PAS, ATPase and Fis domain
VIGLDDLPGPIRGAARRRIEWAQYGALGVAPRVEQPPYSPTAFQTPSAPPAPAARLRQESANAEAALIQRALATHGGNATQAALVLGISRATLWRKRARYGV